MANQVFNEFKRAVLAGEVDLDAAGDDIRVSWHMTNTTIDTENDGIATNNDFTTPDEFDGSGYSTPGDALANEAVNKDDANDRAEFDADNYTKTSVSAGTRDVQGLLVYKFVTNWISSLPICWIDQGTNLPFTPNGGDITIQWNAEGILQLS